MDALERAIWQSRPGEHKNELAVLAECDELVAAGAARWVWTPRPRRGRLGNGRTRREPLSAWVPLPVALQPAATDSQLSLEGLSS